MVLCRTRSAAWHSVLAGISLLAVVVLSWVGSPAGSGLFSIGSSIASGGSSGSLPSCFNALFVVKFLLDLTFFGMGVSEDTFSLLSFEAALFDGVAFESVFDRDDSERPDFTVDALVALVAGEEGTFFEERLLVEAVVPLRFLVDEDDCFLVLVARDDGFLVLLADGDFSSCLFWE